MRGATDEEMKAGCAIVAEPELSTDMKTYFGGTQVRTKSSGGRLLGWNEQADEDRVHATQSVFRSSY